MILRRYMTQQVATTTALVMGFLTALLLGGRMIRYFGIAAEGRLDVGLLFAIIGYNLPYFLELILPLSFFISLMLVFGRLYVDHEMAVLNGSGLSRGSLARLMTPLILALFVAEAGLSMFGKPWGYRNSETIWQQQALDSAFELIRPKTFINSDDYHLYVGSMSADKTELQDIILIQTTTDQSASNIQSSSSSQTTSSSSSQSSASVSNTSTAAPVDKAQKEVITLAKRAVQVQGSQGTPNTQLDLYQGRRYEVGANSQVYNQVSFERYRISMGESPTATMTEADMATQPLSALWRIITGQTSPDLTTIDESNLENNSSMPATAAQIRTQQIMPAQAELGYRLALPWLMIIAPMLAVPLSQVRPRQGRWLRVLPAVLIFTSCALVIISLKNAVAKGSLMVWAYPLAIIGFMVFALYLNWASRIHHRVRFRIGKTKQLGNEQTTISQTPQDSSKTPNRNDKGPS